MTDFSLAKHNMIEQQIRPWEVIDPQVLDVFAKMDRDQFVPEELKGLAYADCQLPIMGDQHMLPPTVEGRMLQALNLKSSDSVLEIGCCSGYLTACLASLAQNVTSVDLYAEAAELAQQNLQQAGIDNVTVRIINTLDDITDQGRFDVITVSGGSLDSVPDNLKQALAIGGRLFVISGQSPVMEAQLITRLGQLEWRETSLFETDIARYL
jgi:protein-L-isoaspartate(D-aspartate) O-methyltransferase